MKARAMPQKHQFKKRPSVNGLLESDLDIISDITLASHQRHLFQGRAQVPA